VVVVAVASDGINNSEEHDVTNEGTMSEVRVQTSELTNSRVKENQMATTTMLRSTRKVQR